MIAAHHFQLSDQAIRDLHRDHGSDIFVSDMYSQIGLDAPGMRDGHFFELSQAPGQRWTIAKHALSIKYHCDAVSTTSELQNASKSLCDEVANPALGSLCQDMEDTADYDHCDDSPRAQISHFMRATQQTTGDAYNMAKRWIMSNVENAAAAMSSRLAARNAQPAITTPSSSRKISRSLTSGEPSKYLGRALHALQDSFSGGHTLRDFGPSEKSGPILHLYAYKTQDHEDHDLQDRATVKHRWTGDIFSDFGRVVIDASRELIWLTVGMAHANLCNIECYDPWRTFMKKWLVLSPQWRHYSDNQSLA